MVFLALFESLGERLLSEAKVIPRDLFNEANVLKCFGKLWIATEGNKAFEWSHNGGDFIISDDSMGMDGTTIANVQCYFKGNPLELYIPRYSREPWPLVMADQESWTEIDVLDNNGGIHPDFKLWLQNQGEELGLDFNGN